MSDPKKLRDIEDSEPLSDVNELETSIQRVGALIAQIVEQKNDIVYVHTSDWRIIPKQRSTLHKEILENTSAFNWPSVVESLKKRATRSRFF